MEQGIEVVVVDNASGDGSADTIDERVRVEGWGGWARVVRSAVNGGFAAGNNLGLREADAETYLLLNSDTIALPGALASLLRAAAERPEAGLIAPRIERTSGERDDNTFRFPHPVGELARAARTGPVTRLLRRFDTLLPLEGEGEPDWVGFACVLVRREVVERVGMLDDGFFMYFEDADYCRRARAAGFSVLYWPEPGVIHLLGGSSEVTSEAAERRRAPRYYYEARSRYFAKHHGLAGLWSANVFWSVGRGVSLARETLGRKPPHLREREGRDIWMNALHPLRESAGPRPGGKARTREVGSEQPLGRPGGGNGRGAGRGAGRLNPGDKNNNPAGIGLAALLAEDFATYDGNLLEPGFWAVAVHRFGNWRMDIRPKPLRAPFSLAYRTMFTAIDWLWGIDLCYTVRLGRRVRLWHHGGMVLGAQSIGDDVQIRHNTTFGLRSRDDLTRKPVIEDRVDVGVGACVLGDVTVGHDSVIGANSVVLRDVPPHSTVLGVPARPVRIQPAGGALGDEIARA
jgi:hypothetical protein